ncbi:unnamed protein product [Danaus chrysippus]|uniref:(African queen) hypothetical protein n=1 Tax=Danaus chrysippus TaxID=151541 RepID=A0A8J2W6Z9_9NEOP|nr:unnamed protein product [Danaus chrysippus]
MSDVKELIKQRGHIKARVTLFEKYLKPLLECKEISLVQVNELRLRLSKIRDLSCTFDDIQSQIEMLDEDTSKQMQEREFNENIFFCLSAEAQSLIDFFENKNKLESSSNKSRPNCHLKLPPIKITPFNGEANKWLSFRDTYVSLVHNNETIDDVNKFHYLKTYLEGPASAVINSVSVSSDNYSLAWKLLCERYDNKRLLINEHIKCLFSIESLTKESHSGLRNLIDTLSKNLNALHILGEPTDKWDTLIIFLASAKLDSVTSRKWEEYRSNKDAPTLDDFYDFLRKRSMVLETMNVNKPSKVDKRLSFYNTKSFLSSSIESPSPSAQCLLCKQNHKLYECNTFKSLPVSNRINKLKLLNQSFNIQEQSDNNSKNLPTLSPAATAATDSEVPSSSASVSMTAISTNQSLLSTALVKVTSNGKTCILRALLDCGSQSSFVTVRALRETGSQYFDSDYHSVSGSDGIARVADVFTSKGVVRRAVHNLCSLENSRDVTRTSKDFEGGEDMPGNRGAFLNYTEAAMLAAVNDVRLYNTPIRTAAKKFGVPRITLTNKVKGKSPMERKMGPISILTPEEEHKICDWVQKNGKSGFSCDNRTVNCRTWVKAFIRRNPTISKRISQNLTAIRAKVTGDHLSEWYKRVYKELEDSGQA